MGSVESGSVSFYIQKPVHKNLNSEKADGERVALKEMK